VAFLDDVGAQLASAAVASSSGGGGYVLVRSWLPDSTALQDKVVALIETGGMAPGPRAELDRPGFQLLVRGASIIRASSGYVDARAKAEAAKLALHALVFTSTSGRYYPGVLAQQDPFLLQLDDQKRPIIATNYLAWRSRT